MRGIKVITAAVITAFVLSLNVNAEPELKLMNCTAYHCGTVTATGKEVREGLCATDPSHLGDGWCAVVYQAIPDGNGGYKVGSMLWILECEDTGAKTSGVYKGYTLDVYRDSYERCQEVMDKVYENGAKGKVFVQYLQAEG